ncbi:MATE family efflux transporter [Roseococcus suduntuyensis]|uniref:O-antigen/teichoic acid export membrane protein n=1 Tax=Roseococcus suduntuyensis TaxID=455361 RepID=A0A840A9S1_9PROT|nr:hypothetical protein [Roseococcus suduntuyensis]MBB3897243.1 O-antigen/teichoic acid export membrane protein [Roseococcus suduntuyensis]
MPALPRLLTGPRGRTLAGIADQAVISLANFGVALAVLRLGTKEEFGLYALGYMAVVVANSFAGGMFGSQFIVAQHGRPEAARPAFAAALLLAQLGGVALACLLALGALAAAGWANPFVAVMLLVMPAAVAQDFLRVHRLALLRPQAALALDGLNAVLWAGFALAGLALGLAVPVAALAGHGAACAVTAAVAAATARLPLRQGLRGMGDGLRTVWDQGRWSVGGVAVTLAQNQAHFYILGVLAGLAAVADVNAARMLLTPAALLLVGVNRTLIPGFAQLRAAGEAHRIRRQAVIATLVLVGAVLAYALLLWAAWDMLARHLLQGRYDGIGPLVALWTLVIGLQAVTEIAAGQLQAASRFRALALRIGIVAGPVVVALVPMILWLGGPGSLMVLAAGQAALGALLWREVARETSPPRPSCATTGA